MASIGGQGLDYVKRYFPDATSDMNVNGSPFVSNSEIQGYKSSNPSEYANYEHGLSTAGVSGNSILGDVALGLVTAAGTAGLGSELGGFGGLADATVAAPVETGIPTLADGAFDFAGGSAGTTLGTGVGASGDLLGAAGFDPAFTAGGTDFLGQTGLDTSTFGGATAGATDFLGNPLAGNTFNLGNSAQGVVPDNALGVPSNSFFLDSTTPTVPVSSLTGDSTNLAGFDPAFSPNPNAPFAGANVGYEDPLVGSIGDTGGTLGNGEGIYDTDTDIYGNSVSGSSGAVTPATGPGSGSGIYNVGNGTYTPGGTGASSGSFVDKLTNGIKNIPSNIENNIKNFPENLVNKLTNNPIQTGLQGFSFLQSLSKPKQTDAQTQLNQNAQGGAAANSIISSGGTSAPNYASQTAAIDASINQQIQQQTQAILQNAANSGMGTKSLVVQQQINQLKQNAETQRQTLYQQAATQNVQAALSQLGIDNAALDALAKSEMTQNQEAQSTAANTAKLAGQLAALGNGTPADQQ